MGHAGVNFEHQTDSNTGDHCLADLSLDSCGALDLGDLWQAVDAGFFGTSEGLLWRSEDADEGALDAPAPLGDTEIGHIPLRRKRSGPGVGRKIIEDFLDEREKAAFALLYENVRNCWAADASAAGRQAALSWVFTLDGGDGPSFDLCCRALGVRQHVIRLRINYQWYLTGHAFDVPLGFWQVPLPSEVEGELLYWGGQEAVTLAEKAWRQPGVSKIAQDPASLELCWMLEGRGILGECGGGWYVIGRNPSRIAYAERSWGALW